MNEQINETSAQACVHCAVAFVLAAAAQVSVKAVTHIWAVGHSTDRHQLILCFTYAHKVLSKTDQSGSW